MNAKADVVDIHGTEYTLIAARLRMFREDHPDWRLTTKLSLNGNYVRVKATVKNENGKTIATGHAEEDRGLGNINQTSAVENTETSAVGRALAFVSGKYAGNAIRSADEMANAISQQGIQKATQHLIDHNTAWKLHEESIHSIKAHVDAGNLSAVWEEWNEIPESDRLALKVAPTKGGWMRKEDKEALTKAAEDDFDPERGVYRSIADKDSSNE